MKPPIVTTLKSLVTPQEEYNDHSSWSQWQNYRHSTDILDLAAFLSHHDLLTAGIKVLDNPPESYTSWKSTFCNATGGLNLRSSKELDLLTKWLGRGSLQHALRIRAVHINNPAVGLDIDCGKN